MFCNPRPVFLTVSYDRQLTFREHVRKLCQSMSGLINLLRALKGTTCGYHTSDRGQVKIDVVRSVLEYAASVLAPWLSATTDSKRERVQLHTAIAITGLVSPTQVESVLGEDPLPHISMRFQNDLSSIS